MIIDANVATYWFVETPFTEPSRVFLSREDLIAPTLIRLEVASALLKYRRSKLITLKHLHESMSRLDLAISELVDEASLLKSATDMASDNAHKIYDCAYLALALERGEPLATADKPLAELARKLSIKTEFIRPGL
jgi:predicted nucleic acid-binding protein